MILFMKPIPLTRKPLRLVALLMGGLCFPAGVLADESSDDSCRRYHLVWAVGDRSLPVESAPYAILDQTGNTIVKGDTTKEGVAKVCVSELPQDATVLVYPESNSAMPAPLPEPE